MVFAKSDFHFVIDEIKEVNKKFLNTKIVVISEKDRVDVLEVFYKLGVYEIFFNFNPEAVLNYINELEKRLMSKDEKNKTKQYIIDFYFNKSLFIIDLSGAILEDKLTGLKLMFTNYLKEKIKSLRGVVYILSDVDESLVSFRLVWALFNFWQSIGINYKQISYLTQSSLFEQLANRYFLKFGIKKMENLLEASKYYFPELANKSEMELFEFSSQLLLSQKRTAISK